MDQIKLLVKLEVKDFPLRKYSLVFLLNIGQLVSVKKIPKFSDALNTSYYMPYTLSSVWWSISATQFC